MGIGPGGPLDRTPRAEEAIARSSVIVGYRRYLELIADLTNGKELITSGMTEEVKRCRLALARAQAGEIVALVSSGDPGIYGMAGLAIEVAAAGVPKVPVEIIPGITAAHAAAARLGAPLMLDYAAISLSDLLVPWKIICGRLEAVASADLVVALYNPRSRKRATRIEEAAVIFRKYRPGTTPVGIGTSVGTQDEQIVHTDLDRFLEEKIGMRSTVVIGNRSSKRMNGWFITPRGYKL